MPGGLAEEDPEELRLALLAKKTKSWVKHCLASSSRDKCELEARCQWIAFGPKGTDGPGKCVPGPKPKQEAEDMGNEY